MFDWSIDWLTSQTGQLTGQTLVNSKSPIPRPSHKLSLSVLRIDERGDELRFEALLVLGTDGDGSDERAIRHHGLLHAIASGPRS